jgi:multidrug/hemolysin transport system permease protein
MKSSIILIKRNIKLFFKDKGMFFTALITPAILLVLYATFLGNVYRDSFVTHIQNAVTLPDKLIDSLVASQLISSILAVSCVTVAFCSNFLMVQDKANGTARDFKIAPIKSSVLSLSYYVATILSTLLICFSATAVCLIYLASIGFYMSVADVFLLILDVFLLVLFGTALSSVINFFLSSQGQISAVGTIVSSGYGFICGAYMPISSFNSGLQKVISFLPGTYGTSLVRYHSMRGGLAEMENEGVPAEIIDKLMDAIDCNLYFFDHKVEPWVMYLILSGSILILLGVYIALNALRKKEK